MVKIGFIGTGIITECHFKGLEQSSAKITSICDLNEERAKPAVEKYGAKYFKTYEDMFKYGDVDGVIIALPNHLHYECSLAAMAAGKHVFCEKPMTTKLSDSLDLVKRVKKYDKIFQVGYMKRFHPGFCALKDCIPALGELEFINFHIFTGAPLPKKVIDTNFSTWHQNPQNSGGGFIVHSGSHLFDILRFYFGDVKKIRADVRYEGNKERDYYLDAQLQMQSGIKVKFQMGRINVSNMGPSQSIVRGGWDECIELVGTQGIIKVENPTWQGYKPAQVTQWMQGEPGAKSYWVDSEQQWINEMNSFVKGIENNQLVGPSVFDGYKVDQIIAAIYKSADEEREIEIENGDI